MTHTQRDLRNAKTNVDCLHWACCYCLYTFFQLTCCCGCKSEMSRTSQGCSFGYQERSALKLTHTVCLLYFMDGDWWRPFRFYPSLDLIWIATDFSLALEFRQFQQCPLIPDHENIFTMLASLTSDLSLMSKTNELQSVTFWNKLLSLHLETLPSNYHSTLLFCCSCSVTLILMLGGRSFCNASYHKTAEEVTKWCIAPSALIHVAVKV